MKLRFALDPDVEKVLDFMLQNVFGEKLLFVARAVAQVAELAWIDAMPPRKPWNGVALVVDITPPKKVEPIAEG